MEVNNMECKVLPPIWEVNPDINKHIDDLYNYFKTFIYTNKIYYKTLPVGLRKYPIEQEKEESFFHLTHKTDENTNIRLPDYRRCERIKWIKPAIESNHYELCNSNCFLEYETDYKNSKRLKLLNENEKYIIILEKREGYYLLITAFYIEHKRRLNVEKRLYEQYINAMDAPLLE